MDTHQKNHCNRGHTNYGRPRLSETRHSVANRIGMYVKKKKSPIMDLRRGIGGSPWLDSTHTHTHTHKSPWSSVKTLKCMSMVACKIPEVPRPRLNVCVCVCVSGM